MHSSTLTTLFFGATLASTAVLPSALPKRVLTEDDIIVWGNNGRVEVMKRSDYSLISSRSSPSFNINAETPSTNTTSSTLPIGPSLSAREIEARGCKTNTVYKMNPDQTFLNWDVLMSQVVKGNTDSTSVSVTEGFTIGNSLTVSESIGATVEGFLSSTFSISYTETWSSFFAAAYTFSVPEGKFGAVVSNPSTTRRSGHVDIGCVGVQGERYDFTSDSYSSKSYDALAWVDGVISLCTGDSFPLPRCLGEGTL